MGPTGPTGPTGSQGPVGPLGPSGPTGPQGAPGTPLKVVDATGAVVGAYLGSNGNEFWLVLRDARIWRIDLYQRYEWGGRDATLAYASTDCSGTPYLWSADPQWVHVVASDATTAYAGGAPAVLTIRSYLAAGWGCTTGQPTDGPAFKPYALVALGPWPPMPALPLHVE